MFGKPAIAYEGLEYTPSIGTPFLREFDLSGLTFDPSLGNGTIRLPGAYQIDVNTPILSGVNNSWENLRLCDLVANHFEKNTVLLRNELKLIIGTTSKTPIEVDGAWLVSRLTIQYNAIG